MRIKTRKTVLACIFIAFIFMVFCVNRDILFHGSENDSDAILLPKFDFKKYRSVCAGQTDYFWKAFNRTKSDQCRSKFANAVCLTNMSSLLEIQTNCLRTDSEKATYISKRLGCFSLSLQMLLNLKLRTPRNSSACIRWCQISAMPFAFLAAGGTCMCSSSRPPTNSIVHDAICPALCALDSTVNQRRADPLPPCNKTVLVEAFETGALPPIVNKPVPLNEFDRSIDTKPVRIVYLLIWHGRSWPQMKRLFRLIYHPRHYYYIHVDKHSHYLYQKVRELVKRYPDNVYATDRRWDTIWGGNALLSMVLSVMSELMIRFHSWNWDFFINLSGADMPIRPHNELVSYLSHNKGKLFLGSTKNRARYLEDQGLDGVFVDCDRYVWFLGHRPLPTGIVMTGGSDWLILPREFVEYVTFTQDEVVLKLRQYYQHALLPVESFFHVVACNTRFCSSVITDNLRWISWDKPRGCECKHGSFADWCGCSPVALRGPRGFGRLCQTAGLSCYANQSKTVGRPVFFARKFDPTVDLNAINFVITTLLNEPADHLTWMHYLENVYCAELDTTEVPTAWRLAFQILVRRGVDALRVSDSSMNAVELSSNWTSQLNVFALFNGSEQASPTSKVSGAVSLKPLIPYPPKLVFRFDAMMRRSDSPIHAQMEFLIRVPFMGWVPDQPVSELDLGAVTYIEVTTGYDGKEQLIRNYPRLITVEDKLQLIILWKAKFDGKSAESFSFYLDLRNPEQQSCSFSTPFVLTVTRRTQHAFECEECFVSVTPLSSVLNNCTLTPGRWQIGVRTSAGAVNWAPFFLLPSVRSGDQQEATFLSYLTAPDSPWHALSIEDYCWNWDGAVDPLNSSSPEHICHTAVWSSRGPTYEYDLES